MLFRDDIEPNCSYCRHGTDIGQPGGRGDIACSKRGIVAAGAHCRKFRYEPTKREPEFARSLNAASLSEEDFLLS